MIERGAGKMKSGVRKLRGKSTIEDVLAEAESQTAKAAMAKKVPVRPPVLRVPADRLLGQAGSGFIYAMQSLDNGRLGIAAQSVGIAEAARCLAMLERDLTHADAMLMEAQALAARKGMTHGAIPAALGMLRFHENKLDESVELFKEARTLARAQGRRLDEFQANEYLAMIDFERGRPEAAQAHCKALVELGDKLRGGSERPFARALDALCHYAVADDSAPLDAALDELRAADAKHRLAYTLTRAALLDVERRRPDAAIARASEALGYAEALDRATEILLAHAALARARKAVDDIAGHAKHVAALKSLERAPVALWARDRALALGNDAG